MAKLLLVEDDNNLREIYEARLAAEGYEISSAQDGEEALVVAKQSKPDLVISDVMMPKISGFEMLDILRNTPGLENVKVIMLTALGQNEDRDRADNLGADKYLVKSQVTLEDIVKTAQELLAGDEATADTSAAAPETQAAAASAASPAPAQDITRQQVADVPMAAAPTDDAASSQGSDTVAAAPAATDDTAQAQPEPVAAPPIDDTTAATTTEPAQDLPQPVEQPTAESGSTAQEQAVMAEQINQFVEQMPVEQQPVETPSAEAAPLTASSVTPAVADTAPTDSSDAQTAQADDQLVANAVDELAGNDADTAQEATDSDSSEQTPAPAEDTSSETDGESADDIKAKLEKTNISVSGKKVIQPLDSEPKPDINQLLAKEEGSSEGLPQPVATNTEQVNEEAAAAELLKKAQATTDASTPPEIKPQSGPPIGPAPAADSAPIQDTADQPSTSPTPAPSDQKEEGLDPNSVAL